MQTKKLILLIFIGLGLPGIQVKAQYLLNPMNGGLPGEVLAMNAIKDKLYTIYGLDFNENGRQFGMAVWDGKIWRKFPVFTSDSSARFTSIAEYKGAIYFGGKFSRINRIPNSTHLIRWNGRSYEAVLSKMPAGASGFEVSTMVEYKGQLMIGGLFLNLTGINEKNIVVFDGDDFNPFDPLKSFDGRVSQMLVNEDTLTIAGMFNKFGTEELGSILQFKENVIITKFGFNHKIMRISRFQGGILAVASDSSKSFGVFDVKTGRTYKKGIETLYFVNDFHAHQNNLFLTGFAQTSEQEAASLLVLDGDTWKKPRPIELSSVRWLESYGEQLVIGGNFKTSVPIELYNIARILSDAGFVSGRVFIDKNPNCQFDARDQVLPYTLIEISPGPLYIRTDLFGYYKAFLPPGKYTLRPVGTYPLKSPQCSDETLEIGLEKGLSLENQNFPLVYTPNIRDMKLHVYSSKGFRAIRGNEQMVFVRYQNNGSLPSGKGSVILQIPDDLNAVEIVPRPDSISGSRLVWNFNDMNPGDEAILSIRVEIPSGIQAEQVFFNGAVVTEFDDDRPQDNQSEMEQLVSAEEQFNEKQVLVQGSGVGINTLSYVHSETNELHYYINFGNYSTDTIKDVVVIDTIDLNLDMRYFQVTGSSHNWTYDIISGTPGSNKGIFIWRFEDINLVPNPSKINDLPGYSGFVSFKIGMNNNLTQGTRIRNAAQIIYDYHSSHLTNEVWCEVNDLLSSTEEHSAYFRKGLYVYPNPSNGVFTIEYKEPGGTYTCYNELGQTVANGNGNQLDLSAQKPGLYFLIYEHQGDITTFKLLLH